MFGDEMMNGMFLKSWFLLCIGLFVSCVAYTQSKATLIERIACDDVFTQDSILAQDQWKQFNSDTVLLEVAVAFIREEQSDKAQEVMDTIIARHGYTPFSYAGAIQLAFIDESKTYIDLYEQSIPNGQTFPKALRQSAARIRALNTASPSAYFSTKRNFIDTLTAKTSYSPLLYVNAMMAAMASKFIGDKGNLQEGLALAKYAAQQFKQHYPQCYFGHYQAAISLGRRFINLDQPDSALVQYQMALAHITTYHPDQDLQIYQAVYNIADAHEDLGQLDSSELYYEKALELLPKDHPKNISFKVGTYSNLAALHNRQGNKERAQQYYIKAIAAADSESEKPTIGKLVAYANIGSMYIEMGLLDRSLRLLEEAREISIELLGYNHIYTAMIILKIGQAYAANDACDGCEKYYLESLNIRRELYGENHSKIANVYVNLGLLADHKEDFLGARAYIDKAIIVYKNTVGTAGDALAAAYNRRASININFGEVHEAEKDIQDALDVLGCLNSETACPPSSLLLDLTEKKARVALLTAQTTQEINQGLQYCDEAHTIFQYLFRRAESVDDVAQLVSENAQFFKTYVSTLIRQFELTANEKWLKKAIQLNADFKQTKLLQSYREQHHLIATDVPLNLRQQRKKITNRLKILEKKLLFQKTKNISQAELDTLASLKNQATTLDIKIARTSPAFGALISTQDTLDFRMLQQSIAEDQAILDFAYIDSTLITFIITKDDLQLFKSPLNKRQIDTIKSWQPEMNKPLSTGIESSIFGGVRQLPSAVKKLTIIPNEYLANIPFEMLRNGQDLIIQQFTCHYTNSLQIHSLQKRTNTARKQVAIFAPTYVYYSRDSISELSLPGAKGEVTHIKMLHDADVYKNEQANKEQFLKALVDYQVVHITSHATIDGEYPLNSRFIMSEHDTSNADVTLEDLLGIESNTRLAVLSACETGRGAYIEGTDVRSLSNGFQFAGIPSVVLSLWKVPDQSTSIIMKHFHDYVKQGEPLDVALHQAKKDYLDQTDSEILRQPYYWAGFIVVGDVSPIDLGTAGSRYLLFSCLLGLFLFAAFIVVKKLK